MWQWTLLSVCLATPDPGLLVRRADEDFFRNQMRFIRFRNARIEKEILLHQMLVDKQLPVQPEKVFLRIFKQERELEVWVQQGGAETFGLLKTYSFCASSGVLGPKRRQGDRQNPEGFYSIDRFNPVSNFHLSLGLDYPNRSDRLLGDPQDPGGDIFIHGNCVTIGCVPITDDLIKEVYLLCVAARSNGQTHIPVHIFPARLTASNLAVLVKAKPRHEAFWTNLQEGYAYFEQHRRPPEARVVADGTYRFR